MNLLRALRWSLALGAVSFFVVVATLFPDLPASNPREVMETGLAAFGIIFVGVFLLVIQQRAIDATWRRTNRFRKTLIRGLYGRHGMAPPPHLMDDDQ